MYMVLCIIDQPEHLQAVLQVWRQNGITGVTIFESTGLHRLTKTPHIAMRFSLAPASSEKGNYTLILVLETKEIVNRCMSLAESVVGDFEGPNSGIFTAWPIEFGKGISNKHHIPAPDKDE